MRWARLLRGEARRWARRIADGDRPLTVGEQTKLRSFLTNMRDIDKALIGGRILDTSREPLDAMLAETLALSHTEAAAETARIAHLLGFTPVSRGGEAALIRAQGKITADWEDLTPAVRRRTQDLLAAAKFGGKGPAELARELQQITEKVVVFSRFRALNIARTELADVAAFGALEMFADYGVNQWRWHTNMDERTCEVCVALHGRRFPAYEHPHRHHMCRCQMIPVGPRDAQVPDGGYGSEALEEGDPSRLYLRDNPGWRKSWAMRKPDPLP
jgi:SPP1 gp7 family putative phage head morphogenesis protein